MDTELDTIINRSWVMPPRKMDETFTQAEHKILRDMLVTTREFHTWGDEGFANSRHIQLLYIAKCYYKENIRKLIDELWDKADEIKTYAYPYEGMRALLNKKIDEQY